MAAVNHALSLCRRVEAALEIVHVPGYARQTAPAESNAPDRKSTARLLAELGVHYSPVTGRRSLEKEMQRRMSARPDIIFIVLQKLTGRVKGIRPRMERLAGKIHIPVVLLME